MPKRRKAVKGTGKLKQQILSEQRKLGKLQQARNDARLVSRSKVPAKVRKQAAKLADKFEQQVESKRKQVRSLQQKKSFVEALKTYKPKPSHKGKFVFISSKGKVTRKTGVKGVWAKVSETGKVKVFRARPKESRLYRRKEISIVNKVRGKSAVEKAMRAEGTYVKDMARGKPLTGSIRKFGRNDKNSIGETVRKKLIASYKGKRRLRKVVVKLGVLVKNKRTGEAKTIRVAVGLDFAQMVLLKRGEGDFVSDLVWRQISTELAMSDMVTEGSASAIESLPDNEGETEWTDGQGNAWGKEDYDRVEIERVDYDFEVESK